MTTNLDGNVTVQASSFTINVHIDKTKFDNLCDGYWNSVKDRLDPIIVQRAMKGYKTLKRDRVVKVSGGYDDFYRPILVQIVDDYLVEKGGRQAIMHGDIHVTSGDKNVSISSVSYLEPEITWHSKPGIDSPIEVKIPKLKPNFIEEVVASEIDRVRHHKPVLIDAAPDTKVEPGHVIVLDCTSVIDGTVWPGGTFTNNKWTVDEKLFKDPTVINNTVGMLAGESKSFTMQYNDKFGTVAGKTGTVTVKINGIFKPLLAEINDDLAVSNGYDTLDKWKAYLTEHYTNMLKEERESIITNGALNALLTPEVLSVEPLPHAWLAYKANQAYQSYRDQHLTEEQLLIKFSEAKLPDNTPVKTKEDLLIFLANKIGLSFVTDLVLKSWGIMKGVDGYKSLHNLSEYADKALVELVNNSKIVEVEDAAV